MVNCPIKQCGRKFENEETMLEHVRRRHPLQYNVVRQNLTQSMIEKEHVQQQQLSKLPKLAKLMSREKKGEEGQRKSSGKLKKVQSNNLSSIIQETRQNIIVDKSTIAARRPSLTKKLSASDHKLQKLQKLPPIEKQIKKTAEPTSSDRKQIPKKQQNSELLYQTLPDFKAKKNLALRPGSKGKLRKSIQKIADKTEAQILTAPNTLRNTMTNFVVQRPSQQNLAIERKKNQIRPTKKIQRKLSGKTSSKSLTQSLPQQLKPDFEQKIVVIKCWPQQSFQCPSNSKIQFLYANSCNLTNIILNQLQSLQQISLTHNKIKNMQFLQYTKNTNIKVIHIDHNEITQIYTPPKLKVLTISFNKILADNIQNVCNKLKKSPQLEEIDFSFNNVRKAENYKLRLLANCGKLKKIDGMKITKIDIQLMQQFVILQSKHKGLIPLSSGQDRPSTAVSQFENEINETMPTNKTIDQLQKQQRQYQKLIKQTEQQLQVIKQQNQIINSELSSLNSELKGLQSSWDSAALFHKLQKQCQFLQLLHIMQHADQEQLSVMVANKKQQLGITD